MKHLKHQINRLISSFPPLKLTMAATPTPRSRLRAGYEIIIALLMGAICHILFTVAVIAMILNMWSGMSLGKGNIPYPWSWIVNCLLLFQFPIVHSFLLTKVGNRLVEKLAPHKTGATLFTTIFAIIASTQLLLLFVIWTPSGTTFWRAEGWLLWIITSLYILNWLFLIKASWDAGAEVQSGMLGWLSLFRSVKPHYPPMPIKGTFKYIRHPIYLAFALTTWTVPTWTPDQLLLACVLTTYCVIGPLAKEKRFKLRYGINWELYKSNTPFWIPSLRRRKRSNFVYLKNIPDHDLN